jgi:MYXO-CTERM domain-containing protein
VIGVYSILLSNVCEGSGVRNSYTQVAPFEGLILDALNEAGHEPIVEPPKPSAGAGGTSGTSGTGGTGGINAAGSTAQGGEAGATGEGGAPAQESGGTTADGGTGGSGASGGSSGTAASGGTDSGTGGTSEGSGSRRDPSCACRTAGSEPTPHSLVGLLLAGVAAWVRRRLRS